MDTQAVNVRLHVEVIAQIDAFRKEQPDLPTRPEAIRRLLTDKLIGLGMLENK